MERGFLAFWQGYDEGSWLHPRSTWCLRMHVIDAKFSDHLLSPSLSSNQRLEERGSLIRVLVYTRDHTQSTHRQGKSNPVVLLGMLGSSVTYWTIQTGL
jgi:hypothetical protein